MMLRSPLPGTSDTNNAALGESYESSICIRQLSIYAVEAVKEVQHNLLCCKEHKDVIHMYLSFALGRHVYRSVHMATIDYCV